MQEFAEIQTKIYNFYAFARICRNSNENIQFLRFFFGQFAKNE